MSGFLYFLIPVALLATLGVLALGIYSMGRGGSFARDNGNKFMRWRVAAQAGAIAIMCLFLLVIGRGPN